MNTPYIYAPETIIKAYSLGVFPMAASKQDAEIHFYEPQMRGIIPITPPHIPRRLLRTVRQTKWHVTLNSDFRAVIENCAAITPTRKDSWINAEIIRLYLALHKMGFAHSVEVWEEEHLIGGLYGIRLGGAFFGESMFSHRSNASKIALAHLMARLFYGGFTLLDAQFANDHLLQFGLIEISKTRFQEQLQNALNQPAELPLKTQANVIFDYFKQAKTVTS